MAIMETITNSRFIKYQNGNYEVIIDLKTGTKVRQNDLDYFYAEFPESMDIKITNWCDMNCPFCHERSSTEGKHGDIMNIPFFESLHPYTELAIGGGNPLAHPDLIPFLEKCKEKKLIPSITVHEYHFEEYYSLLEKLRDDKLIYGLGVSISVCNQDFLNKFKKFPNGVLHVINGIIRTETLERLKYQNLKILILGYKNFGRGVTYDYNEENQKNLYIQLRNIIKENWFDTVSFDNLAIQQLDVVRLMPDYKWKEFYMGDDGTATMYVDLVNQNCARSSTEVARFKLENNIRDMFAKVRQQGVI